MSMLLSVPAIRNFACCQMKEATSRPVKYFRAASPRANQNSEAPIIIVLSTSKNAAAVRSGAGAAGTSVSAAAADASPATTARVSWSSTSAGLRAARPRKGTRTTRHHPLGVASTCAATLASLADRPGPGQQPTVSTGGTHTFRLGRSGGTETIAPGELLVAPALDGGGSRVGSGSGSGSGSPGRVGVTGAGTDGTLPPVGAAGADVAGAAPVVGAAPEPVGAALLVVVALGAPDGPDPEAEVAGSPAAPDDSGAPLVDGSATGHGAGRGPSSSVPSVDGPPAQATAVRRSVPRTAT